MTQLLYNYNHVLRFTLSNYIENVKIYNKFKELQKELEYYKNKNFIDEFTKNILANCKLESNKLLPLLKRCEGGFGGDSNLNNKQIRYRNIFIHCKLSTYDNDIILNVYDSDSAKEIWTYDELDDIVQAFIITAEDHIGYKCVKGCIQLEI